MPVVHKRSPPNMEGKNMGGLSLIIHQSHQPYPYAEHPLKEKPWGGTEKVCVGGRGRVGKREWERERGEG